MRWSGRTAVYTDDAVVDDHAQREEVEHVGKVGPHMRCAVFP